MIFGAVRDPLLRLLRTSAEPPDPPAGTHDSVEIFRASPAFLSYRLVGTALGGGVALLALAVVVVEAGGSGETGGALIALAVGVVLFLALALVYVGVRIDYEVRHYVVTDRSVRLREGAWTVREKTVTFANVQNLRVTQGPLQRLFGISDLRIDTAGGGGAGPQGGSAGGGRALTVAGIADAAALRDRIDGYVRRHGDAGLGDPDDPTPAALSPGSPRPGGRLVAALVEVREAARELRTAAGDSGPGGR